MSTLAVDSNEIDKLRKSQGYETDQDLAAALGINKGTLSRVLKGKSAPGPRFISSVLRLFPVKFEDVFQVIDPVALAASDSGTPKRAA